MQVLMATCALCFLGPQDKPAPVFRNSLMIPEDISWNTNGYMDKGMPPIDRPWVVADYVQAVKVLKDITYMINYVLPRHDGPNSGPVFARFVSEDNLAFLSDESIPGGERLKRLNGLISGIRRVQPVYQVWEKRKSHLGPGWIFDEEMTEFVGFRLKTSVGALKLVSGIVDGLPDASDKKIAWEKKLDKLRQMHCQTASGLMHQLTRENDYRKPARRRMARYFLQQVPLVYKHGDESNRKMLRDRIDEIAAGLRDPEMKKTLAELRAVLK